MKRFTWTGPECVVPGRGVYTTGMQVTLSIDESSKDQSFYSQYQRFLTPRGDASNGAERTKTKRGK